MKEIDQSHVQKNSSFFFFFFFLTSIRFTYYVNVLKTGPDRPIRPIGHKTGSIQCKKPFFFIKPDESAVGRFSANRTIRSHNFFFSS